MLTLGIHDGHDAGVAILENGDILYASNEERFSRKKMHHGFPSLALENAIETTGVKVGEFSNAVFGSYGPIYEPADYNFENQNNVSSLRKLYSYVIRTGLIRADSAMFLVMHKNLSKIQRYAKARSISVDEMKKLGFNCKISHLDHHSSHAASAYYSSGFNEATVITLDGGGDGLSGSIWIGSDGHLVKKVEVSKIHSVGNFWDYITYICGFSPMRHGGKITGLAAYEPCDKTYDILGKYYSFIPEIPRWNNKKYLFWSEAIKVLKKELQGFNKEQIAWGAQKVLEDNILGIIKETVKSTGISDVVMAGGVFANVRLNQKILEMSEVRKIFIHPHMGDGGLALGAAYLSQAKHFKLTPKSMEHAYLGSEVDDESIINVAGEMNVKVATLKTPEMFIAQALRDHKVVGLVKGKAEYGPRSLCNRSILAEPTDTTMMNWLNDRLGRTEFMPFAPVIMEDYASKYFEGYSPESHVASFMTVCYNATELCKINAPGVVHIDGTARPQVVTSQQNKFIYNVLGNYLALSGLPLFINTSFNRHEEPIVNSARDAISELIDNRIDVLVINQFHIKIS